MKFGELLREKKITAKKISDTTGLKYGTVLKYSSGELNMGIRAAKQIASELGMEWWELINLLGEDVRP